MTGKENLTKELLKYQKISYLQYFMNEVCCGTFWWHKIIIAWLLMSVFLSHLFGDELKCCFTLEDDQWQTWVQRPVECWRSRAAPISICLYFKYSVIRGGPLLWSVFRENIPDWASAPIPAGREWRGGGHFGLLVSGNREEPHYRWSSLSASTCSPAHGRGKLF